MAEALLDVNLLVALAWPTHVHHEAAHRWFAANSVRGWATCSVTQAGFVRISANPRLGPDARSPREAVLALREIVRLPDHYFWPDDEGLAGSPNFEVLRVDGYRQVTDAQLVALAMRHGGRVVTFDRGMSALVPPPLLGRGLVEVVMAAAR